MATTALKAGGESGMANITREAYNNWKAFCEQVQSSTTVNVFESKEEQALRLTIAKKDYNYFVKTYFPIYADADCGDFHIKAANKIVKGKRPADDPNLIAVLEWPREHAKSVHADILIPMWMIANGSLNGMILMGKNEEDACTLLSDIQAQLQNNNLFIHDYGEQFNYGDWQDGDFTTKGGIRFMAIGRDQSPRGARKGEKRPNYAVCDDIDDDQIVNNQKRVRSIVERILGALFFGLETKNGGTLVIAGNRIHAQSILAHIVGDIKPGAPKREGIYHSKVFAIDPETGKPAWWQRYTVGMIMNKIKKVGNSIGRKEMFHENDIEGTIFKDSMIHWMKMRRLHDYKIIIGYFDPSFENNAKSDFKAVRVWGGLVTPGGEWRRDCLKSFVRRTELTAAFQFMSDYNDRLPVGVGVLWCVEKQFFNRPIQEALRAHNKKRKLERKPVLIVITDPTIKENKYVRIVKMEPAYSNNEVAYNIDEMHNPDMVEGNNQLKGIEPGYNSPDDSPDADQGAWNILDKHQPDRNWKPMIGRASKNGW